MLRRRALLALLAATATCAAAAPSASAAPQWISGVSTTSSGPSCFGGTQSGYGQQTQTAAMYWGDPQAAYPAIGDKYYMQLHSGQIGFTCPWGIADVATELILPANTQLAINLASSDPNDKVRCFHIGSNGAETDVTNMTWRAPWTNGPTGKWCDSTKIPSRGTYGYHLGMRLLSQGTQFVVRVPVMSTKRLAGMGAPGDTAKMAGAISSGVNSFTSPMQWVTVHDRATSIAYPNAPTTEIGERTATTSGTLNSWYRKGNVYVDLGTAASGTYAATAGPFAIDGTYPQYTIKQGWGELIPGTDYRWRLRFVDESGVTTTGDARSFRTAGTAPAPGGNPNPNPNPNPGGGGTTPDPEQPGGGGTTPDPEQPGDGGTKQPDAPAGPQPTPPAPSAPVVVTTPSTVRTAPTPVVSPKLSAPVVALARGAKLGALKKGIAVNVTCAGACTAKAQLKVDAKTAKKLGLGAKALVVATGTRSGSKTVAVPLKATAKAAARLAKARSVTGTLTVTLSGGGTASTQVTLKR